MGERRRRINSTWAYKSFWEKRMGKLILTMAMAIVLVLK
jgi:hypothetical protein